MDLLYISIKYIRIYIRYLSNHVNRVGVFSSNCQKMWPIKTTKPPKREEGRRDGADSSGKQHPGRDIGVLRRRRQASRGLRPHTRRRQEGHHLRRPRRLHPHLQVSPSQSFILFIYLFIFGFLLLCWMSCLFERLGFVGLRLSGGDGRSKCGKI